MNNQLGNIMIALYALLGLFCITTSTLQFDSTTQVQDVSASTGISDAHGYEVSEPRNAGSLAPKSPPVVSPIESKTISSSTPPNSEQKNNNPSSSPSNSVPVSPWSYLYFALLSLGVAALVFLVKHPNRVYLGIAFAIFFVLLLIPRLGISSIGLVGLLACIGFLIHFLVPKQIAEKSVFLGIGLAFFAFAFAVAGGVAAHSELQLLERYSTAFYEATQLPLMNMSPHEGEDNAESKFYFMLARIFGCLFAYFLAYKTVAYVCERARTEFLLGWYCVHSKTKLALVIGLGTIGRRLIRNLLDEGHRVVVIEADKESVYIERAQALGAQVIVGDALDDRVYEKIPFDAVGSIYVVAGDDRKNLEISHQLLTYSIRQVEKMNLACSPQSPWWTRSLAHLVGCIFRNEEAVCHVQVYDSNMQSWMEKEYFKQQVKLSHIEMRHFNAQQNAVRDLVQRELTKPGIRPQSENEVALYFVVGFESLGQEVAIGIAQLAHFENLKRSRIVVLCSDPEAEAAAFLARYPKFCAPNSVRLDWSGVQFDSQFDDWDESRVSVKSNSAQSKSTDTSENTPDMTGQRTGSIELASEKVGVTFATNAIFTRAPVSPSDASFLELIYRLTQQAGEIVVKPSLIVCDKDVSRAFQWSSEFTEAWKKFSQRKGLRPECPNGTSHPSLTTYFWLQGHQALRELSQDNVRHIPFGLEENCISTALLEASLIRKLASVVEHSYSLATSSPRLGAKSEGNLEPTKFEFLKSNLQAAAHSLIKFQIAGGRLDSVSTKGDALLPKIESVASFTMDGHEYTDPRDVFENDRSVVMTLGKMEHNRWMAEQLLKGYEFVEEEADRVDNKRLPQHEHQRQTLCCWKYLSKPEQLKDLRQAYYVLYHLHSLSVLNSSVGRSSG